MLGYVALYLNLQLVRGSFMSVRKQEIPIVSPLSKVHFRKPRLEDGPAVWSLVRDTQVLDLNSSYCYLMLSSYFQETCVVAEKGDQVVGFVSGFIPENQPKTLFIWQVAVSQKARGLGIGTSMLKRLLSRPICRNVRYLETTVSPSNAPSEAMFRRIARDLATELKVAGEISAGLFPGHDHEPERVFRIGPFDR